MVDPSRIPEPGQVPGETPARYAARVARSKVQEVSKRHHRGLIIGADTIVVAGGERYLGKPSEKEEARSMLRALEGRWHQVVSGISLMDCESKRTRSRSVTSRVHFRRLSGSEIDWYLKPRITGTRQALTAFRDTRRCLWIVSRVVTSILSAFPSPPFIACAAR